MIIDELFESPQQCPECGGISFSDLILAEKKDACYHKVKASAKVWPSAYASGRLVQCRKKGAANYGNKSEGVAEGDNSDVADISDSDHMRIKGIVDKKYPGYELSGLNIGRDGNIEVEIYNYKTHDTKHLKTKSTSENKQGVAEGMDSQVVFSGTGADGGTYEIIQSSPTDFMIHANGRHIDTYGSLQRAMSVLQNEVPGLQQGMAEGKADPVGSWVVYDGSKVKRFKSREGAKAYAAKNGGKVASSEFYADKIQKQGMAETRRGQVPMTLKPSETDNLEPEDSEGFKKLPAYKQGQQAQQSRGKDLIQQSPYTYQSDQDWAYRNGAFDARQAASSADFAKRGPLTTAEGEQQKGADYRDPKEVDYDDDYDAMVARVKRLAGLGPMKTVYDPARRQYRNMPTAVQPKK